MRTRVLWIVVAVALALPALRLLPVAYGHSLTTPDRVFVGFGFLPKDLIQYAAMMQQAKDEGGFFLRNDFTLEPQDGRYALAFYWGVGRLAALFDSDVLAVWHAAQYLVAVALLLSVWRFLAFFFSEPRDRLLAYALIGFGGGFEWLVWWLGGWLPVAAKDALTLASWPMVGWNTFESLFNPALTAAYLALIWALVFLVRGVTSGRKRELAVAAGLVVVTYSIHGYTAIGLGGILAAAFARFAWEARRGDRGRLADALRVAAVGAAFLAPLLLSQWQSQDGVFRATSRKALFTDQAYPFYWWPVTYGLLLVFAAAGLRGFARRAEFPFKLVIGWLLAGVAMTHLPLLSPYKLQFLLHLPLCIVATVGLRAWVGEPRRRAAFVAVLSLLFATNLWVVPLSIREVRDLDTHFLPRAEFEAIEALRELERGAVLASPVTAGYVPWLARKPVYVGHWFLTLAPAQKWQRVRNFYAPTTSTEWRVAFLRENDIRYLYYGSGERRLGRLDPRLPLVPRIEGDGVTVYEVE